MATNSSQVGYSSERRLFLADLFRPRQMKALGFVLNPTCLPFLFLLLLLCAPKDVCAQAPTATLTVSAPKTFLVVGESAQLRVILTFSDGTVRDVTPYSAGTGYSVSDPAVGEVSLGGLVTARRTGAVTVHVINGDIRGLLDGSTEARFEAEITFVVGSLGDADGDGMPDSYETANGLNPNNPDDAFSDNDNDGLTNLREFQLGTDPNKRDTDGDGLDDSREVALGSDPLNPNSPTARPPTLDQNCTASILNRNVQIGEDGTFALPNVPVDQGLYRVRVVCRRPDGTTVGGQSEFLSLTPPESETNLQSIAFGSVDPIPTSIRLSAPRTILNTRGETIQAVVTGTLPDGSEKALSTRALGTVYATSNPRIATVSADGLVRAVSRGQVVISARNEGALASITINVDIPNDADGDGITDEYERANGLNPNDAADAGQDTEGDGLTNLQEFHLGTNPRAADTDGDGLTDGAEVTRGTNPLRADTDGDGLSDGAEVAAGTNPLLVDTDGDGLPDGFEVRIGTNPLVPDAITAVQGRIVDSTGTPVSGATAIIFNLFTAISDATGYFTIPQVPTSQGNITVLAQKIQNNQVFAGKSGVVSPVANGTTDVGTIQIVLDSGSVSGIVSDLQNRPVAGAQIRLISSADIRTATTDATGLYRITNVVAGAITVTARDPNTGLQGRSTGTLPTNQSATINIRLGPSAAIAGTVFGRDGATPVGSGVTVAASGPASQSTRTDGLGKYSFEFLPLGSYTVDASDSSGNRGRSSANLTATGQTATTNIAYLGRGVVTGLVRDGANNPVVNASVNLRSDSIFGGSRSGVSDASGRYSFSGVFVGPYDVSARSQIVRLGGSASGRVDRDGQTVTTDIMLVNAGTITGRVFRSNSTTAVTGASVSLSGTGLTATTDSQGQYRFDQVPLGSYTIDATDASTGDRGRATTTLATQDETRTVNVNLNGQGQVIVTVRDAGGTLVTGAQVTVESRTQFGGTQSGMTQADGTATFARVLAGSVGASALDPATRLSGSNTGNVTVGATTNITVNLQPSGTIAGTVFASDGTTAMSSVSVRLTGPMNRQVVSGTDGAFRFEFIPLGLYSVEAVDGVGNVRAHNANVAVSTQGQVVTSDLRLLGAGTVTGRVSNVDGTPARGIPVSVRSQVAGFTQPFQTTTDINGDYSIRQAPVGTFTASASARIGAQQLFGQTQGQIATDGQIVTADIQLSANLAPVTQTLYDANNQAYKIREDGSIQDRTQRNPIVGDEGSNRVISALEIVNGGTATRFTGQSFGTTDQGGRQIAIQQQGIAGLDVTRQVFVPRTGYFARYIETLNNPTAAPITVAVRVSSNYGFVKKVQNGFLFDREPRVITTSSGDNTLDVSNEMMRDRWATVDDDEDIDPFQFRINLAPFAHVFDGVGGAQQAGSAAFNIDFNNRFSQLVTEWSGVTVQPGQTVAFMHFVAPETSRASAQLAAERLVQLPPEALTGLTATEAARIQNFAVPVNGMSPLAPLPSLNGTVNGRALAADGTTPVAGATVTFKSDEPLFGRTYTASANGNGEFSFTGTFNDSGSSIAIPVTSFMLEGTNPQTNVQSPMTPGSFPNGLLTVTQNVVFSNSGIIAGVVRRTDGTVVSSGNVRLTGGPLLGAVFANIAGDGSYLFTGVPAGTYSLLASIPHPQGTGLTGNTTTQVIDGQTSPTDITIQPAGSVTGMVRRATGDVVVNLPVQLRGLNFGRSATTDTFGAFNFTDVPVGTFTLETVDQATNTAATAQVSVAQDTATVQNLSLVAGGTVMGIVTGPNAQPISGAQVMLTQSNGVVLSAITGPNGLYLFNPVAPGNFAIQVFDAATNLRGRATGNLGISGQIVNVDIRLSNTGTVMGTVFRSDGVTPVAGAQVAIYNFFGYFGSLLGMATTDALGHYSVDLIPVGSFIVDVSDSATGDRGRANNQINANGEVRTINVTLNGVGRVVVTVRDAAGTLLSNASVALSSQTQFGGTQSGTTSPDGTVRFDRVLAGSFTVSATDQATGLNGSANGNVAPGATANVAVQLQPAGSILGRVLAADGITPLSGITVRLFGSIFRQATSGSDGSYRFDAAPLGTYNIDALDGLGRRRALVRGATLSNNAEELLRDVIFVGLGTVTGQVLNPNNTAAANIAVTLRSANADIGGFFNTTSDSFGNYTVNGVPVGGFTATANDPGRLLQGETTGQITADGQVVTANIQLLSNAINLPTNRFDANDFFFNIQPNGSIFDGTRNVFRGDFNVNQGGFLLDVISGGTPNRFSGGTIGTTEENGREIVVRQQGLAGLDVTRKVYVPRDGYFVRYLELLTNPTANPITIDLRLQSNIRQFNQTPIVTSTSSGDAIFSVADGANPDRWLVVDGGANLDPFLFFVTPAVSFTFDGAGAAERAGTASFTNPNSAGQVAFQWNSVTVAPGATVAYLHFGAQQTSRAAAQASAERLVELPPEALVGLGPVELSQIRNFNVPSDGVGTVAPLPALNGTVFGQVLAGDNTTPVPFGQVRFKSNNILFGRTQFTNANTTGAFTFTSTFNDFGGSLAVPIDGFTLTAIHPQFFNLQATVTGTFAAGQNTATRNVVFSNTGLIRGTVRRANGAVVTSGFVQTFLNGFGYQSANIAADGTYVLTGIPARSSVTVTAYINNPQGSQLTASTTVATAAGQTTIADITLPATGAVTGTVRNANGTVAPNVFVRLRNSSFSFFRSTNTDASGHYTLSDVPVGGYIVEAFEPASGIASSAQVSVLQDQTTTAPDIALIGFGQVQVQVNFANGNSAANSQVNILEQSRGYFRFVGFTDSAGRLIVGNVPVGNFTVRAFSPNNGGLFADVTGSVANTGDVVAVTVALPGTGTVTGTVTRASGAVSANTYVELFGNNVNYQATYTDSNGKYTFAGVPAGRPFSVRAYTVDFANSRFVQNQIIGNDGDTLTVNLALPASAMVRVTILRADNTPFAGARIDIRNSVNNFFQFAGYVDASGVLTIPDVPEGSFSLRAFDPNTFASAGTASGTVLAANDGQTIDITINAPLSGNVEGHVYAADGQTPLRFAYVEVRDVATNQYLSATYTDGQGFYRLTGIQPGAQGFKVVAYSPNDFAVTAEATGNFTTTGETVTKDLTLLVSVVKGTVRFSDGVTPALFPNVFITQPDPGGFTRTFYANSSDDQGHYTVIGVGVGNFTLTGQDNDSGLTATATGNVADVATPVTVDVTLPASGSVTGTVRDAANNPAPFAQVAIAAAGNEFERFGSANAQGVYRFDRVGLGSFIVQARDPNTNVLGSASGTVTADGETVTADISLPATGTVTGTVFAADGTTPVANTEVDLENFDHNGPLGNFFTSVTTDASGNYEATNVQVGTIRVTAFDPNNFTVVGLAQGELTTANPVTINVALGNGVRFGQYNLDGTDGFRYDVDGDGRLNDGGTVDRSLNDAYDGSYYLRINGKFFPFFNAATLEDSGREVVIGSAALGGLSVTRKVFSPAAGGFARYLEILTNPSAVDRTVTVEIQSNLGSDNSTRVVVAPADVNNRFAVTDQSGFCCDPALAHVFDGLGGRTAVTATQFVNGNDQTFYRWSVTVPAGQTAILMHFAVQRGLTDTVGARAQAEALLNLTDPNALQGMSVTEKTRVLNFNIP